MAKVSQRTELGALSALPTIRQARIERGMRLSPAQRAQLMLTSDVAWDQDVGSGGASCVAMMQPADRPDGDYLPRLVDSRRGFRLDLAVASRAYSKRSMGVGQLDPERGNVNDCAVDEVLRRHRPPNLPRRFQTSECTTRCVAEGPSCGCPSVADGRQLATTHRIHRKLALIRVVSVGSLFRLR